MTSTVTAIHTRPEPIVNNEPKLHPLFDVPSVAYQGDLCLIALPHLPKSAKPRTNRQLAEGSSQGSRHVMTRGEVYTCEPRQVADLIAAHYRRPNGQPIIVNPLYIGPVFVSPAEPTENDLSHPEHGNQGFPAGTICAVVFQRNLDSEEREQRSRD